MLGKTYGTNRGALWNMLRNTVSTWGNLLVTDWELDRNIVLTHWAQQKSKRKRIWVYRVKHSPKKFCSVIGGHLMLTIGLLCM